MLAVRILTVVFVAAWHTGQSQYVITEQECQNLFHDAKIGKRLLTMWKIGV